MGWFEDFRSSQGARRGTAIEPIPPSFNENVAPPFDVPPENLGPVQPAPTPTPTPGAPPSATWNPGPVLQGWDPTKWANQSHQSHKYRVGRILAKYPPTVDGLKQALPELQQAYPGASIVGLGDLDLGLGEAPVDVLQGASGGGRAWQWLTADEAQGGGGINLANLPSNASIPALPGGGAFGGAGGGSGAWSMPKGSEYQFKGVPGFTGGSDGNFSGSVGGTPTRQGGPQIGGAFGQVTASPTGNFGMGQVAPSTTDRDGRPASGDAPAGSGAFGSYDRAPSFTPMDPFQPPPSPDAMTSAGEKFVLPTGQAALDADPGYKFRVQQGVDALQNSASAKGLLRTGGTLKDIQDFGQRAASQEYQSAVDRALAAAGFNEGTRRYDTTFNADQQQQKYQNTYDALNQRYAYANQQNLAGNAQALEGYKTDVGRELGRMGIQLTADQNAFVNSLNAQQQQWMQAYMMNGQSFDQAYKLLMANLQYPH